MPERISSSAQKHIRDLKSHGEDRQAEAFRKLAVDQNLRQVWEKGLNDSLLSHGLENGINTLNDEEKEAVKEYYNLSVEINEKLSKGIIQKKDVGQLVQDYNQKHEDLFPSEEESPMNNDGEKPSAFIFSLRYITSKFRD